jgi:transposase
MPGSVLNSQSQQLVVNLIEYFEKEKENMAPLLPLSSVLQRVADALKIAPRTVSTIKSRHAEDPILRTPNKKRQRVKQCIDIDDNIKHEVRNVLYDMCAKKQNITVTTIYQTLKKQQILNVGRTSVHKIIKECGFRYKKSDNRRALFEQNHIAAMRTTFLREYIKNQYSSDPLQVVFLDETWIFGKGNPNKSWQNESVLSVRNTNVGEGKRFVILHAGNSDGFIPNTSLIFSTTNKSSDYHDNMNSELFVKWLKTQLLPNLEQPSLIVMDNAPYHSTTVEKQPTASWKKVKLNSGWT